MEGWKGWIYDIRRAGNTIFTILGGLDIQY
jgi:hypothetical protein